MRDDVLKMTRNRQEPFRYGSLGGAEIALVAASPAPPPAAPPPVPTYSAAAEAARVCREVESMSSLSMLGVLANQHKGSPAGDCITSRMDELKQAEVTKQTAESAKRKADEAARAKADAEAEAQGLALQKKEEERKRVEAEATAKKRAEADAAQKMAAATPPPTVKADPTSDPPGKSPTELALAIQTELKRVGCDPGPVNGAWGAKSRHALGEFARATKTAPHLGTLQTTC